MLLVIHREPRPDATCWPGRRWLAAIDAVSWPIAWIVVFRQIPDSGIFGPVVTAIATLCAIGRLHRAWFINERYWFTTWRWLCIAAALLLLGAVMKLSLPA